MTVTQRKNKLAQMVLQTEDKAILTAIELLFEQSDLTTELSAAQKKVIDKRLSEVEEGTAKYYTISEMKKMVRKPSKKR